MGFSSAEKRGALEASYDKTDPGCDIGQVTSYYLTKTKVLQLKNNPKILWNIPKVPLILVYYRYSNGIVDY